MRIVSWNCCDAFERKLYVFADLAPSIAVISECTVESLSHLPSPYRYHFVPSWNRKGLAFIYRDPFTLTIPEVAGQIVAAVDVSGPATFRLVGVWPSARELRTATYVHEIHRALQQQPQWLRSPVILAGDFNSHPVWDRRSGELSFTALTSVFKSFGIYSAYHLHRSEEHGGESEPTFSFRWKREDAFHIDYIFASRELLGDRFSLFVGERTTYLENRCSDHVPLVLEIPAPNASSCA